MTTVDDLNDPAVLAAYRARNASTRRKYKYGTDTSKEAKAARGGFDSDAEARYYQHLSSWLQQGLIRGLVCQPRFEIVPKFETIGGKHSACHLTPDFMFEFQRDGRWVTVAADVKGQKPDAYFNLRRKLFQRERSDVEFWIVREAKRNSGLWEVEVM